MAEIEQHEPGMLSWADLCSTDAEGAKAFYTGLLGLEYVDIPAGEDFIYTLLQKNGKNVAGLTQMGPDMQQQGIPTFWSSYIAVTEVDETAAKAKTLGGTLLFEPMDVMEFGRMVVIQDPAGAMISAWQGGIHKGADIFGEPGALAWCELRTQDTDTAAKFYDGLFGWAASQYPGVGGMPYNVFMSGGQPAAGMVAIPPVWGEVPPHWIVHFMVENLDSALGKVEPLGGSVIVPPMSVSGVGKFAQVADPQGGHCMIMEAEASS